MEVKLRKNIGGYNVLVTTGDKKEIRDRELFSAHL